MLSRPNFSIRRLISTRRHNSDDEDGSLFWDNDEKGSLLVTDGRGSPSPTPTIKVNNHKRRNSRSWLPSKSTKKIPQPIIVVRSTEDIHRITYLPPLPDTPHSSKSSLCSCEQHALGSSPRRLPAGRSPGLSPGHASILSKSDTCSGKSTPPPPGSPLENPRPSPRLPQTRNKSVKSLPSPGKLTFDLLEALQLPPDGEEMIPPMPIRPLTPPKRKSSAARGKESEACSENVQQLIRETEEAFKSPTGVTTQGKLAFDAAEQLEEKSLPTLSSVSYVKPAPLKRTTTKKRLSKPALSPLKSPTRSGSVTKAKRQKSQTGRRKPRAPVKKHRSKWTVNAKDLLNVRLFGRLEANEVLSPTRLQEIRMSRTTSQLQTKRSTETLRTIQSEGSDTPIDPFNLQDLPSRIGAAGVRLSIPTPIEEVPTPRSFDFAIPAERRDSLVKKQFQPLTTSSPLQSTPEPSTTTPERETMRFKEASFPIPPAKNPLRFRKELPRLPSIPEKKIPELIFTDVDNNNNNTNAILSPSSNPHMTKRAKDKATYIYLRSRPYTLTMPSFRHGSIRIAKADIALAYSSSKLAAAALDESLDWTAFQMAIQGGAGDFYSEATDYSRRTSDEAEDEVDGLCEWFDGFGFGGYGHLDRGTPPPRPVVVSRPPSDGECSPVSTVSAGSVADQQLPIAVEHEHPNGFWNSAGDMGEGQFEGLASRFNAARGMGIRRWAVEGHPKRYEKNIVLADDGASSASIRRPSVDTVASLPQSPMLDLVVSHDADGNEYVVPMGYNLGHDLGDFLRWEAENVYASGFLEGEDAELEG